MSGVRFFETCGCDVLLEHVFELEDTGFEFWGGGCFCAAEMTWGEGVDFYEYFGVV